MLFLHFKTVCVRCQQSGTIQTPIKKGQAETKNTNLKILCISVKKKNPIRLPEADSTLRRDTNRLINERSLLYIERHNTHFRFLCDNLGLLANLTASTARKHTRQQRATETKKKAQHGQRKYGCAGEDSPQTGPTMDEAPVFYSLGDQLAHLDEVLGCKILQAKKAEGCV